MALWNSLSQAATPLAGVDAGRLISMIVQAVQTVRRNREECQHLMRHVMMIGDLLQMLQQSETMQRPEIRRPLDGLEETLRQAYMLIVSCQQSNIMYRFLMAGTQAQKFRDIRDRINSYLQLYPLVSHIDTREFITRLYSSSHPSVAEPQTSEELLESSASNANPDSENQGSVSVDNETGSVEVGAVNEPFVVQEQKHDGTSFDYGNTEVLPNRRRRFRWLFKWAQREPSRSQSIHEFFNHKQPGGFTVFEIAELVAASNNFTTLVGTGGTGNVYKGVLPNGVDVAIKCIVISGNFKHEFAKEIQIIPKLQHANVIKLLGCCSERDCGILVYEYAHGGSLNHIIHELKAGVSMAWPSRFHIIEGIAQGAVYLHQHSRLRVVHGDVKSANILLDSDMTPRITDFGLSEILSSDEDEKECDYVKGTPGYIDPHYCATAIISTKSDVYGFGVICLEIICARHAFDNNLGSEDVSMRQLARYACELWSPGRAMELIDGSLRDDPQISKILRCLQIALLCVQLNPVDRPTMSDVLMMLKCDTMILPMPMFQGVGESSPSAELNTEDSNDDETSSYLSCCSDDEHNGHAGNTDVIQGWTHTAALLFIQGFYKCLQKWLNHIQRPFTAWPLPSIIWK